jgi:hypothetical protein
MAGIFLAYVGWYLCPVHARRGGGPHGVFGCTGNFSFHRLDIYDTIDVALLVIFITLFYFLFIPNPGSENFIFHPGSASKNLSILPKKLSLSSRKYDPGCSSWIRILIFYPSRIPDPGSRGKKGTGSPPNPQQWHTPPPHSTPPSNQPPVVTNILASMFRVADPWIPIRFFILVWFRIRLFTPMGIRIRLTVRNGTCRSGSGSSPNWCEYATSKESDSDLHTIMLTHAYGSGSAPPFNMIQILLSFWVCGFGGSDYLY